MENRYYILSLPEPAAEAILAHTDIVETDISKCRKSLDGKKILVKTKRGKGRPDVLPGAVSEYTHEEIRQVLATAEWCMPDSLDIEEPVRAKRSSKFSMKVGTTASTEKLPWWRRLINWIKNIFK